MNKIVLTDTGFWCALYEPRDQHYDDAQSIAEMIEDHQIILPWPIMYEFLNTRFTRRNDRVNSFRAQSRKPNITFLDDTMYKNVALNEVLNVGKHSLVDSVIRQILSDVNVRIDYLITFNISDFEDVCHRRRIEIISN